jgi:glyoxylase-like metal-dependent hydrolase (beta-lactamase superfamily II)
VAASVPFLQSNKPSYGVVFNESALVRKLIAPNPGPFTYWGTGTYIVGRQRVAVIDPGPPIPEHVEAIEAAVRGEQVSHILVTHSHLDHSPAARPLGEKTGAPILAFGPHGSGRAAGLNDQEVEAGADRAFDPDERLADGERLEGPGWTLEAIHTPGHTSNHLCFALLEEGCLFSGDHIMGWSTTVISPPDGDMALYLESLEAVRAGGFKSIRPTHGPEIKNVDGFLGALIEHRLDREKEILAALQTGSQTIDSIVMKVYEGLPNELLPAAAGTVLAHLIWLVDKGVVKADPEPLIDARFWPQ